MTSPIDTARAAWGADMPDWVEALAQACAASSQSKVATRLGRSAAMISQVLRNKYPGDHRAVADLVRGHLLARTVECPALGTLPMHECRAWMAKATSFENTNTLRVRMFRACRLCPRFKTGETQ